jgi:hypothetical protein
MKRVGQWLARGGFSVRAAPSEHFSIGRLSPAPGSDPLRDQEMFRGTMRNRIFAIAAAIVTLTAGPSMAQAQSNPWTSQPCSDQTIKGTYLFALHGKILNPTAPPALLAWVDGVGTIKFDGNGGLTQQDFVVQNAVAPDNQTTNGFRQDETGTYAVFPDCTGKAEVNVPGDPPTVLNLTLVISPAMGTIHAVVSLLTAGSTTVLAQTYSDFEKIGSATGQNTQ